MVRPKKPAGEAKTIVIPVRFTTGQRDEIRLAASHEGLDLPDWLRKAILESARSVNERASSDPEIARLSPLLRTAKPTDWKLGNVVALAMIRGMLPTGLQHAADKVIEYHRPTRSRAKP